ncbi:MAG: oligoendopeptidase F, partial [Pirellulales bacterium]|nr:oligoendopeptidase F [Pirellulales bacterium]
MSKVKPLPPRNEVKKSDCWDLSSLFPSDEAWETAFLRWEKRIDGYARFQGTLAGDVKQLAAALKFDLDMDREGERLGTYAFLKTAEDTANSTYQRMQGRFIGTVSRASQAASYLRPEILSIPKATMKTFLDDRRLKPYRLMLERLLRYRPHTLSRKEEKLLALQTEMAQTAGQIFHQLNDADLRFGSIRNERGESIELSHASFSALLHSPKRGVRRKAFHQYYRPFAAHENTLAAMLGGSIQRDV